MRIAGLRPRSLSRAKALTAGASAGVAGTLLVEGQQVAQGHIERTICCRFSLDETFDVGADTGTPVIEDYADKTPFCFTGDLKKLVIELGPSETKS